MAMQEMQPSPQQQDKVHSVVWHCSCQCFWLLYKQLLISSMSKEQPGLSQITTTSALSFFLPFVFFFLPQSLSPSLGAVTMQQQRKYPKIKWVLSSQFRCTCFSSACHIYRSPSTPSNTHKQILNVHVMWQCGHDLCVCQCVAAALCLHVCVFMWCFARGC